MEGEMPTLFLWLFFDTRYHKIATEIELKSPYKFTFLKNFKERGKKQKSNKKVIPFFSKEKCHIVKWNN